MTASGFIRGAGGEGMVSNSFLMGKGGCAEAEVCRFAQLNSWLIVSCPGTVVRSAELRRRPVHSSHVTSSSVAVRTKDPGPAAEESSSIPDKCREATHTASRAAPPTASIHTHVRRIRRFCRLCGDFGHGYRDSSSPCVLQARKAGVLGGIEAARVLARMFRALCPEAGRPPDSAKAR